MNTAILDRYVPAVLQELLPNGGWSKADCGEHAVDVRIQDWQPSRSIRLDERRRFYEGFRALLLAWVPYLGHCHSMLFYHLADGPVTCGVFPISNTLPVEALMNTTIRTQMQQSLDRANRAIGLGESEGEELDVWWNKFSKLNGGIDAPKSWEQMKRIVGTILSDGREPEVYDVPDDYGQ